MIWCILSLIILGNMINPVNKKKNRTFSWGEVRELIEGLKSELDIEQEQEQEMEEEEEEWKKDDESLMKLNSRW